MKSQAYLVEKGFRLLYTGDLVGIDQQYHPLLKDLDLAEEKGGNIYLGYDGLEIDLGVS